jgi:hypothetical protein
MDGKYCGPHKSSGIRSTSSIFAGVLRGKFMRTVILETILTEIQSKAALRGGLCQWRIGNLPLPQPRRERCRPLILFRNDYMMQPSFARRRHFEPIKMSF